MSKRQGIMLARSLTLVDLKKMPKWVIVQAKLDGDRCRAVPSQDGYKLISSQGNPKHQAVPLVRAQLDTMASSEYGDDTHSWPTLDGELYRHGWSRQCISSVTSRTKNLHHQHDAIQFHAFDCIDERPQIPRIADLYFFDKEPRVLMVPTFKIINNYTQVEMAMAQFLEQGYEGVIVRNPNGFYEKRRSPNLLKLKPDRIGWGLILGFNEAISIEGDPKGMLGSFVCMWIKPGSYKKKPVANCLQIVVGAGRLRHDERIAVWQHQEKFQNKFVKFRYLTETDDGNPREPVTLSIHDEPED